MRLETVLEALRPHTASRLVAVFGCGGDRDRGKRPMMGAIGTRLADVAIVTDDNPRSEDPAAIRAEILAAAPGGIRVAGPDRTATAVAVVRDLWQTPTDGPRRYVLVNGFVDNGWAFGLASAGIGADHDAPTLLVGDQVSASTAELLGQCGNPEVQTVAIGDASVIGSAVLSTVNTLDGQSC